MHTINKQSYFVFSEEVREPDLPLLDTWKIHFTSVGIHWFLEKLQKATHHTYRLWRAGQKIGLQKNSQCQLAPETLEGEIVEEG